MSDVIFNVAHGRHAYYATLPASSDALILVLLKSSGLVGDSTLIDYDTLSDILAGASDEADFTGYARATLTSVSSTVDDTNDRVDTDAADPAAYTNSGGSSQAIGKAIVCYDPDTGSGTDADLIPLYGFDCVVTFDVGVATTISFNASGMGRAA